MTKITLTEKIEIYVDGLEEEKQAFFNFFWSNSNKYIKALNLIYTQLTFDEFILEVIKEYDENYSKREQELEEKIEMLAKEKKIENEVRINKYKKNLSKLRAEKSKEAREILTKSIGLKSQTRTRDIGKKVNFDYSDFIDSANSTATKDFSNDYIGIKTGQRTPRIYHNKSKQGSLPFRGRDIKIDKNKNKYFFSIPKGFRFKANLGVYPTRAKRSILVLNNICNNNYKLHQSKIVYRKGKLFMYLTYTFEKDYHSLELDKKQNLIIRFENLASGFVLLNDKKIISFGDSQYILNHKTKIKNMITKEKSRAVFSKGGHGRKRKLEQDRYQAIKERESNFVRTYNNQCTAKIIQTAIRNNAGTLTIEEPDQNYGDWAYYQFVEQIKQKAKKFSIEVNSY